MEASDLATSFADRIPYKALMDTVIGGRGNWFDRSLMAAHDAPRDG